MYSRRLTIRALLVHKSNGAGVRANNSKQSFVCYGDESFHEMHGNISKWGEPDVSDYESGET